MGSLYFVEDDIVFEIGFLILVVLGLNYFVMFLKDVIKFFLMLEIFDFDRGFFLVV